MEIRHLSRNWSFTGYGGGIVALAVAAAFLTDVFGEYFVSTTWLIGGLGLGLWLNLTVSLAAAVVGAAAIYETYRHR